MNGQIERNKMKTKITKNELVKWMSNELDNCGKTDYFGYTQTIESFEKKMMKKDLSSLKETVYNWSEEGQSFVESFS